MGGNRANCNQASVRLHLGCGTVYLEGYMNIDMPILGYSFLADDRPDLVEQNKTTVDKYYKEEQTKETLHKKIVKKCCVADEFMDVSNLDYPENSVDEILIVQTFEHLSRSEASKALDNWYRILKPGGKLHIDVPDFEETAKQLLARKNEKEKEWYYRLIFGSQKNEYAFHKDGYSFAKLKTMLEGHGFKDIVQNEDTLHFYPAVIVECRK